MADQLLSSLVTVVTAAYNAEKFIQETIRSVQAQTYPNWEMIIVDDCSTDRTKELVKNESSKDERIKLITLERNQGAAVARNTAIQASKGDYIAFLDSDDLWMPHKLEKQLSFMQKSDIAFSFTGYEIIREDGSRTGKVVNIPKMIDYHSLLKNTIIGCLTVMLDKRKLGEIQMPNIRTRQDFALWLEILRKGYIAYGLQETLSKYRLVEGSISSNKFKAAKKTWYVYREIEKIPIPRAFWYFINYGINALKKSL